MFSNSNYNPSLVVAKILNCVETVNEKTHVQRGSIYGDYSTDYVCKCYNILKFQVAFRKCTTKFAA